MESNIISFSEGRLIVPEKPIIPYIEGDGIGPDIWKAAVKVIDRSVEICWNNSRKIEWKEIFAGEKAYNNTGEWLPEETLEAFRKSLRVSSGSHSPVLL